MAAGDPGRSVIDYVIALEEHEFPLMKYENIAAVIMWVFSRIYCWNQGYGLENCISGGYEGHSSGSSGLFQLQPQAFSDNS